MEYASESILNISFFLNIKLNQQQLLIATRYRAFYETT